MSKNNENNVGRPTVITPKVVSQLEALLSVGLTVREACLESEISHEAYYSRVRSDDQFADKMAKSQNTVTTTAKKVVATQVLGGDTKTAMWWLDRLDKKELAKLQAIADGTQTTDPDTDPETEPQSMEDMIEIYEGYKMMIGLKHKMELEDRIYELPKDEQYEASNKLYELSRGELCELAIAEYGHSSWHLDKAQTG